MTRQQGIHAVLALVFLGGVLSWLPYDDSSNALGLGQSLRQLSFDRELVTLRDEPGALRARVRMGIGDSTAMNKRLKRWIAKAERLVTEHAGKTTADGGPAFVQLRGFTRNDYWLLAYQLYPLRVSGAWFEEGGTSDDPLDPAAVAQYTVHEMEVSDEQLREAQQRKLQRREDRQR